MSGSLAVPTQAQWTWSTPVSGQAPLPISYPTVPGCPTKSGVQRVDLEDFLQMTIQRYGNPPTPISDAVVNRWIRYAEDEIEAETNVRLCQTWIAAPPAQNNLETVALNIQPQNNGLYQQLGIDYDYSEAAYDFFFDRAQDSGWLYQRLRWRPVKGVSQFDPNLTANPNAPGTKNAAFIYPLLNEYFRIPPSWTVEDSNRGLIRFVPSTSIQMLPLFAMQLAFLGFTENVPGGIWFQYTAGLTAADYAGEWAFMQQLVLCKAGIRALQAMQLGVNMGVMDLTTQVDGLMQRTRYSEKGPFIGYIEEMRQEEKKLTKMAKAKGGGFHMGIL
jgi:hypothetical protein